MIINLMLCLSPHRLYSNPTLLAKRDIRRTADISRMDLSKVSKSEAVNILKAPPKRVKNTDSRNEKGGILGCILLMFGNKEIIVSDIDQLNSEEKIILSSILKRKFNIDIDLKSSNETICETMNKEASNAKTKRLEENYKLVFKKGLKFLLTQFKKANKLRCRKQELELAFFDHYFKKVCDQSGDTIESFLMAPKGSKSSTQN